MLNIGDPQSLSPYACARNNPVGMSDPSGLEPRPEQEKVYCGADTWTDPFGSEWPVSKFKIELPEQSEEEVADEGSGFGFGLGLVTEPLGELRDLGSGTVDQLKGALVGVGSSTTSNPVTRRVVAEVASERMAPGSSRSGPGLITALPCWAEEEWEGC